MTRYSNKLVPQGDLLWMVLITLPLLEDSCEFCMQLTCKIWGCSRTTASYLPASHSWRLAYGHIQVVCYNTGFALQCISQDATPHVGLDPACRQTLLPVLKQGEWHCMGRTTWISNRVCSIINHEARFVNNQSFIKVQRYMGNKLNLPTNKAKDHVDNGALCPN